MSAAPVPVEIRALAYSDLPDVLTIERRAFPTPWSLAMFVLELSKSTGLCLAVDPDHRREGIASALLAELYRSAGDSEARFTLEVRESNHDAINLYRRDGFRIAGKRRRYYQDNGEDALIMWRTPSTLRGSLDDVPAADPVVHHRR
jgi:[ribosomal protein S18]-alanine N-acetyltransferase